MQIQRAIQEDLQSQLGQNIVLILYGARRVGKTVLLQKIKDNFKGKALILNGEDTRTVELFNDRRVSFYQQWLEGIELLIVDEAQVIPEIGKALKLMIDSFPNLCILASGSSAFDLTNKLGEPLVGRLKTFQLYPFAQKEYSFFENYLETTDKLESRLVYGTYPDVELSSSNSAKEEYLLEMSDSYLLKDILIFEEIRNSAKMLKLLQLIAYQIGQEVSYDELGRQVQLDRNTVEKYLDLFSKVFIIFRVGGFSKNLRKEITKTSKWYFFDNGLRNALINDFSPFSLRQDKGNLWENYILSERVKKLKYERIRKQKYFWRTYDKQEIDWIETQNNQINAFEIKWKEQKVKTPAAFAKAYPEANFQVISRANYLDFIK